MDEELHQLCKEVYEKTNWETPDWFDLDSEDGKPEEYLLTYEDVTIGQGGEIKPKTCPYYTSDYLLEKLPPVVQDSYDKKFRHIQMWINGDGEARACYVEPYDKEFRGAYAAKSDSMLKALLKLTIALSGAGELENDQSS